MPATGDGATACCSMGGQVPRDGASALPGNSGNGGRATGLAAPTWLPQSGSSPSGGTDRLRAETRRPEMAPTSFAAVPRPLRMRRRIWSGWSRPAGAPGGVIDRRTTFSARRRGSGVSQDRGDSRAISPSQTRATRSVVSTSRAGRSAPAPTRRTCPSHWIPSSRRARHTSDRGRGASGTCRVVREPGLACAWSEPS